MPSLQQALDQISADGFSLDEIDKSELAIAFLSLRSAFRAWFSTYGSFRWRLNIVDPDYKLPVDASSTNPLEDEKRLRQLNYPTSYFEQYSETVFHFQHFIELIIKDILRKEHELLVSDAAKAPLVLWKLIKNEAITDDERQKLFSVEFSEAMNRIDKYIGDNKINSAKFGFIKEGAGVLSKLNILRNRLVHRGTFVLPYTSLDEFIGKYLLPIVVSIVNLPEYQNHEKFWKHKSLACKIDPITEISAEYTAAKAKIGKIAFLKELGRAAFENPIEDAKFSLFRSNPRDQAESLAQVEAENPFLEDIYDILNCPVCGSKSLIRFFSQEAERSDPLDPGTVWLFTTNVQCFCCSFSITNELENASHYGLGIEDYWFRQE